MRKRSDGQWTAVVRPGRIFVSFCLLLSALCLPACSVPNLESPECLEARQPMRDFYSFHFGNDMSFTPENLRQRERFLTANLIKILQADTSSSTDPFTLTSDLPKAFRVGACKVVEPNKRVDFEVLLFWKTDTRSEQREISVNAVRQEGKWLIDKILSK